MHRSVTLNGERILRISHFIPNGGKEATMVAEEMRMVPQTLAS